MTWSFQPQAIEKYEEYSTWLFSSATQTSFDAEHRCRLKIVGPLVLLSHLSFLLGGEVANNVQVLADLLDSLVLDEAGNAGRAQVQERRDIQVVGGEGQVVQGIVIGAHDEGGVELLHQLGQIGILQGLWETIYHAINVNSLQGRI